MMTNTMMTNTMMTNTMMTTNTMTTTNTTTTRTGNSRTHTKSTTRTYRTSMVTLTMTTHGAGTGKASMNITTMMMRMSIMIMMTTGLSGKIIIGDMMRKILTQVKKSLLGMMSGKKKSMMSSIGIMRRGMDNQILAATLMIQLIKPIMTMDVPLLLMLMTPSKSIGLNLEPPLTSNPKDNADHAGPSVLSVSSNLTT